MPITTTTVEDNPEFSVIREVFTDAQGKVEATSYRNVPKPGTPEANRDTILARANAARDANLTYLATTPSTVVATRLTALETQLARVTRQVNALMKLLREDFLDTTGT